MDVDGATVGDIVSRVDMVAGEVMETIGTSTEECISGLSLYVVPLLIDTRDVVDFFK